RLLPAPAVVYYVMALALWRDAPLEEVLRVVCEGLQWLGDGESAAVPASKSAISQARTRLGPEVMQRLAQRVLRPLARPGAPGSWYRGLRVMALDGSGMDVADERANAEFFGYPTATRGQSAFPQARILGLVECGTHAIVAADIGPYARSAKAMAAKRLPEWLRKDMLVMADRGFYSFKLWGLACASGATLLWRVSSVPKLPAQQVLSDGSYLSTVFDSADSARRDGRRVRVIEYTPAQAGVVAHDSYHLVTNLLDPEAAPALELAALYHERWEVESVFDEFKTHLRAASTVLRSKTPDLVQQELWGLLLAHFAIRQLMAQAAWPRGLDPDRLGFIHAVRVIRRKMRQAAAVPP
ncbi:MAG: IS4 family transposase, partial [Gammaproteobacteria bacterium]|nr:IS4 family transposase [Gammaproteobacteria bacterium]